MLAGRTLIQTTRLCIHPKGDGVRVSLMRTVIWPCMIGPVAPGGHLALRREIPQVGLSRANGRGKAKDFREDSWEIECRRITTKGGKATSSATFTVTLMVRFGERASRLSQGSLFLASRKVEDR